MGLIEDNEINNNTLAGVWITTGIKKSALYLSVNVFSTELLIGDNIFLRFLLEKGPPFYMVIRATRRLSRLQCEGSTFISQLF